jgi:tRNA-Thr(GGU) m(6)t(6)A37 methyltransferase TsaA
VDKLSGTVRFIGIVEKVEGDYTTLLIDPEYIPGIEGLDKFKRINILYWFHKADNLAQRAILRVVPRHHGATEERGVFASHSPHRPNPIGLTTVDLLNIEGNRILVHGLDAIEGSPIIDIKPDEHI